MYLPSKLSSGTLIKHVADVPAWQAAFWHSACRKGSNWPTAWLLYVCRRGERKPVPFATVVTDLTTCHNTWFHPLVDRCFVPTQYCKRSAMKNGLKEEQARPHGLSSNSALCDVPSC